MSVRIKDVVANMQVVDGDSLLTPDVLTRIVAAVNQAREACDADERSRKRDTKIGGSCHAEDVA